MEEVASEGIFKRRWRVRANKGSRRHRRDDRGRSSRAPTATLAEIRDQMPAGTYRTAAGEWVEIPKPEGGVRKLASRPPWTASSSRRCRRYCNPDGSGRSPRRARIPPGRSAHQAVAKAAQQYIADGNHWVVDLDLEKFFDRVNHDKLMAPDWRSESADQRLLETDSGVSQSGGDGEAGW